jgi:small subunit ribosomal protein S1
MTTAQTDSMMESILSDSNFVLPTPGTLVEGVVIDVQKNAILMDINGFATGIIKGKDAHDSFDTMKTVQIGDTISAFVVEDENEEGYTVLSLRKASQEKTWNKFLDAYENNKPIEVVANEANKGGLLLEVDGIKGFIPVSQLEPQHYPRVNGADSSLILQKLQQLIGVKFTVKIINIDRDNGKLILSEKAAFFDQRKEALTTLKIGQTVKGKISGVVKFGIFVSFEHLEGLVHISEIAWGHVKNPQDFGKAGDEVEVMVIGLEGEKISLSMKRLTPDPWDQASKKYKIGATVDGEINRITQFGVFVKLDEEINGLIHVSEVSSKSFEHPSEVVQIGEKVKVKVISIEPDERRIGLSIRALEPGYKPAEEKAEEK